MMIPTFKKHFWFYLSFLVFQIIGYFLVVYTAYDKHIQLSILYITTVFYIFWSLLHQYIHHHINAKIVVEYVLVGFLGLSLSLFLFNF